MIVLFIHLQLKRKLMHCGIPQLVGDLALPQYRMQRSCFYQRNAKIHHFMALEWTLTAMGIFI